MELGHAGLFPLAGKGNALQEDKDGRLTKPPGVPHAVPEGLPAAQAGNLERHGGCISAEPRTPWFVPVNQPLELLFFHKVFVKLRASIGLRAGEDAVVYGVPLLAFQRAMSRLFHVLGEDRDFDARPYDVNSDGTVGWWEFCMLWKEEQPSVCLSLPERIHLTLECPEMSRAGRLLSMLVLTTIFISAGSFIVSTLPSMQSPPACPLCEPENFPEFAVIDTVCVILFTVEYLMRLVTAACMRMELPILNQEHIIQIMCTDEVIRWPTRLRRIWDFVRALPNLIDLAAILPSYVAWCMPDKDQEDGGGDSSMVVLKLIRLMRIVRAFRLGRRLEAVIIIARSMQRSTRAVWVLVLNMTIGMVIFGAVMFFVEQGTYSPVTQSYTRPAFWVFVNETQSYEMEREESPFKSIPHAFWWALVTSTTAGYGDMYPTTAAGKVTAGVCLVWSLCVIALPVGVIGSNFESVWEEYDKEKRTEREMRSNEKKMEKNMMASIDPLSHSTRLRIEVFHDSRMASTDNDSFVGEAEATMRIDPASVESVDVRLELLLHENRTKSDRRASGKVYLNYSWTPRETQDPGVLLQGRLLVTLVRAEGLAGVDWKQSWSLASPNGGASCCCDPYVVLTVYPQSPSKDGTLMPRRKQFSTVFNNSVPTWNESVCFDFHWLHEGVLAKREFARQNIFKMTSGSSGSSAGFDPLEGGTLSSVLPHIKSNLHELSQATPELQTEVHELRQTVSSIVAALGTGEPTVVPSGTSRPPRSQSHPTSPLRAGSALGSEEGPDADFQFVVPGMVSEEPVSEGDERSLVGPHG